MDSLRTSNREVFSETDQVMLSHVEAARTDYARAVTHYLDAVRRCSELSISDKEQIELLRYAKEREDTTFAKYKQLLDNIQ